MDGLSKNYNRLLILTVFCQILINSTNSKFQYLGFNKFQYLLWGLMCLFFIFRLFVNGLPKYVLIRLCLFIIITIILLLLKDYTVLQLFIFVVYCLFLDNKEIVKDFFYAMSGAVIVVIPLSFAGIFPMYTPVNYLLAYGFNNPNTLGLIITLMYLSYYYVFDNINEYLFLGITILAMVIVKTQLGDNTALIVIGLFYIVTHIKSEKFDKFIKGLTMGLPFILCAVATFLSYFVENYNWTLKLSSFLTRRPEIWNQYYSIYSVHLIPQDVPLASLSNYGLYFYGSNLPLIYRGFDGAYSHDLLTQGIIVMVVILFIIAGFVFQLDSERDKKLISIVFVLLIFAFSESIFTVPFGSFANYLLILSVRAVLCRPVISSTDISIKTNH